MEYSTDEVFGKAIGVVIHDIRNYLNTIIGYSSILQGDDELNNECRNFIGKISQAGTLIEKLLTCIDDYIMDEDELEMQNICIKDELKKVIQSLDDLYYENKIIIDDLTKNNISVKTSKIILGKIIENLFHFSMKGLRGKEDREIQIYYEEENNIISLYYSDTSNPIFIEKDYFTFDEILNSKRGLSLLFAKKYITILNGEIKYFYGNKWNELNRNFSKIFKGNHGFKISIPNLN